MRIHCFERDLTKSRNEDGVILTKYPQTQQVEVNPIQPLIPINSTRNHGKNRISKTKKKPLQSTVKDMILKGIL